MTRKERYDYVLKYFREQMPEVQTELEFSSVFQLLVAVILSAQCTDKRINQVTPELFRHFPDAKTMATAEVERHEGEVPQDMNLLLDLPGVGRKTANVIQSVAFGKSSMAVDTHVFRVSHRLGLVTKKDNTPYKVEQMLVKNIPAEDIPRAHHWLLLHGRYVCTSRKPHCKKCDLNGVCPSATLSSSYDGTGSQP